MRPPRPLRNLTFGVNPANVFSAPNLPTSSGLRQDMPEQLWVEPVGNLIVARVRGLPTEELLQECQRRVVQIARDRAETKVHRVLYDALEMESPSVDVPWEQRRLDEELIDVQLRRAIVVPNTRLAYLARLAFGEGDYRVFYSDVEAAIGWLGESRD
jgi:hypothetical protein